MSHEQFGIYMRLLLHAWLEGSIPADHTKLTRLLGLNAAKFKALWPCIEPCFEASVLETGRLVQPRLERQRLSQEQFRATQAEKGARGGKSRVSNKTAKPVLARGSSRKQAEAKPEASLPFPFPSPSPSPDKDKAQTTDNGLAPAAPPPPPKAGKVTHLTPFGEVWTEATGGVLAYERMSGAIGTIKKLGHPLDEILKRWRVYCASLVTADDIKFASPQQFAKTFGLYQPGFKGKKAKPEPGSTIAAYLQAHADEESTIEAEVLHVEG